MTPTEQLEIQLKMREIVDEYDLQPKEVVKLHLVEASYAFHDGAIVLNGQSPRDEFVRIAGSIFDISKETYDRIVVGEGAPFDPLLGK